MGCCNLGNRDRLRRHRSLCLPLDRGFYPTFFFDEVAMKIQTALAIFLIAILFSQVWLAESADSAIVHAVFFVR
jgi:hypothetical protein